MSRNILVVDDDPDYQMTLRDILVKAEYTVATAGGGDEAIELLDSGEFSPDMVLIDAMMTRVTEGFELAYALRQREDTAKLPVVMITGIESQMPAAFSADQDIESLMLDGFLRKPVQADELLEKVRELLG